MSAQRLRMLLFVVLYSQPDLAARPGFLRLMSPVGANTGSRPGKLQQKYGLPPG